MLERACCLGPPTRFGLVTIANKPINPFRALRRLGPPSPCPNELLRSGRIPQAPPQRRHLKTACVGGDGRGWSIQKRQSASGLSFNNPRGAGGKSHGAPGAKHAFNYPGPRKPNVLRAGRKFMMKLNQFPAWHRMRFPPPRVRTSCLAEAEFHQRCRNMMSRC